jgi:hypothetical protein
MDYKSKILKTLVINGHQTQSTLLKPSKGGVPPPLKINLCRPKGRCNNNHNNLPFNDLP